MPYIRLGTTKTNFNSNISDTLIVSDIVDSGCSYRSPILIRDKDSLDIYFGRSFSQRNYYEELLSQGITLFLYRPISSEKRTDSLDYIDLSEYETSNNVYTDFNYLPKVGEEGIIYLVGSITGDQYIWISEGLDEGMYVSVDQLQQNINSPDNWESWNNRDTLRILKYDINNSIGFDHCYPRFSDINSPIYPITLSESQINDVLDSMTNNEINGIDLEIETFAFILDFGNVSNFFSDGDNPYYFVLPRGDENFMIWYRRSEDDTSPVGGDFIGDGANPIKVYGGITKDEILEETFNIIENKGYSKISLGNNKYKIYSTQKGKVSYFYEFPDLILENDIETTQDILSIATDNQKRMEFYSKTIGPSDDNENIKIKIEKIDYFEGEKYRITISRYDYYEVFEGSIFTLPDRDGNIENLEYIINQESKLIDCKVFRNGFKKGNKESELITGEWELKRSKKETYTSENYWNSLKILKEQDIIEDFLLIPEISVYRNGKISKDKDWFSEYDNLYEYSTKKNCQVLITNIPVNTEYTYIKVTELPDKENAIENTIYIVETKSNDDKEKVISVIYVLFNNGEFNDVSNDRELINRYKNNFIFNKTDDKDNRLVYFLGRMKIPGTNSYRPGYYIFLRGIITNIFSMSLDNLLYYSPTTTPYIDENNPLLELLESKKSNFLVDDNYVYYYQKYFNHPGDGIYNTTILTRFIISKISRTILNNKWDLLGSNNVGIIKNNLSLILGEIKEKYSIVNNLSIKSINLAADNSTVLINLILYVSELVDKNINLSITLNLN